MASMTGLARSVGYFRNTLTARRSLNERGAWLLAGCLGAATFAACSPEPNEKRATTDGSGGADDTDASTPTDDGGIDIDDVDAGGDDNAIIPLHDFPADPVYEAGTDTFVKDAFDAPSVGAGPCITSPPDGALFPRNWLRPRVDIVAPVGHNAFEFRVSVEGFDHDLLVYSTTPKWTLDKTIWNGLRGIADKLITIKVRSALIGLHDVEGPTEAAETTFTVAPVDAPGKIVYWSLPNGMEGNGLLKGFGIGEEGVRDVLTPEQVQAQGTDCIGCHSATPDGISVAFQVRALDFGNTMAGIEEGSEGSIPEVASPKGLGAIRELEGAPAFSKAHWEDGDRVVLLNSTGALTKVSLEDGDTQVIARNGDSGNASGPSFSHDGEFVVYSSGPKALADGRPDTPPLDVYRVPYNDGEGGDATPLDGAADAEFNEYYPALSPDDELVAFNRIPSSNDPYDAENSEIWVVGADGGEATRLDANDPVACTGQVSPGVTNSWAKWAPLATEEDGRLFYFLTFSSRRSGAPQLYVTAIVLEGETMTTYPALYLWNQPELEGNHTPAWEYFKIPDVK
jgi:hypothetical protein